MGFSLDSSSNTTIVKSTSVLASISASLGAHVLHVKSWGNQGASCVTNISINVVQAPTGAGIAVSSPLNGSTVASTFGVAASGTSCSSQPIAAMGFSLDNSSNTTIMSGTSIAGQLSATSGAHVVHVKAWGNQGASCVTNVGVNVVTSVAPATAPTTSTGPSIPSNAIVVKDIQKMTTWQAAYDTATGGSNTWANGSTNIVSSPALSGYARLFATTYSNYGGERYSVHLGTDSTSQNFVYDTRIFLATPITSIANIEMDMNQVIAKGQTVIFGFQCDGWSKTWDYTKNVGTPTSPDDKWIHTTQSCNPQAWSANTWHHIQVSYSRDDSGNVTYKSVWFDGVQQDINVTVPSSFALGWAPGSVLTNFQIDSMTSTQSSSTVLLDKFTLSRW